MNTVPNTLSRLRLKIAEILNTNVLEEMYISTQIIINPKFETRIRDNYLRDETYVRIIALLKNHYLREIISIEDLSHVMEVFNL